MLIITLQQILLRLWDTDELFIAFPLYKHISTDKIKRIFFYACIISHFPFFIMTDYRLK